MAEPRGKNPLHRYVNYTYLISLHLLTKETYNRLADLDDRSPGKSYKPDSILIASAGLRTTSVSSSNGGRQLEFARNALWNEDFYFENLKVDTVIGLNSETSGTNSIQVDFSIIEPNGASLLERLIETSIRTQYMDYRNMVFALQIDFVGYDDAGIPQRISDQTKVIPIKFLGMDFKISERGSEYSIRSIPYNHQALQSSYISIPTHISVTASTVSEYFSTPVNRVYPVLDKNDALAARGRVPSQEARSISDALNKHQEELVRQEKQGIADKFQIVFAEEIGNSSLVTSIPKVNKDSTNMGDPKKPNPKTTLTYGSITTQINAGTALVAEINRVVRLSSFFLNQLPDPPANQNQSQSEISRATSKAGTGPLRWWKIIPRVKLLDYDYIRKDYAKEVTFIVKPYEVYGSQYPGTPTANPPITRKYEYIFTGNNTDILSFDVNFNMSYYIAVSTNVYNQALNSRAAEKNTQDSTNSDAFNVMKSSSYQGQDTTANTTVRAVTGQSAAVAAQEKEAQDPKRIAAADIQEYLMNTRSADMIMLDMTIVGDPELIKQDDVLSGASSQSQDLNGSVPTDSSEVYVEVVFNTPSDYNDQTGLMDLGGNTRTKKSKFSGYYRLISVENNFQNGQFTQKLSAVRIFTDTDYNAPAVR